MDVWGHLVSYSRNVSKTYVALFTLPMSELLSLIFQTREESCPDTGHIKVIDPSLNGASMITFPKIIPTGYAKGALVSALALVAGTALAQDNRVQLRSLDGAMSLEGAFIGFRDGIYVIDHDSLGTLRIEATDQIVCEGSACPGNEEPEPEPELEPVVVAEPVSRTVLLTTEDGRLSIEGDFVEVSGEQMIVDSPTLGRLAIQIVPELSCEGAACPVLAPPNAGRLIAGSAYEISTLLPALLEGYAAATGATVEVGSTNEDGQVEVTLVRSNGSESAEFLIATQNAGNALAALADSSASLVVSNRRIANSDIAAVGVPDLRGTPQEHKLALDGLVLVTHPDNPVRALSPSDIAGIWSGEIQNWQPLGGGNIGIAAVSAIDSEADASLFGDVILGPNGSDGSASTPFTNASDLIAAVRADTGAIGLVPRSQAIDSGLNMIDIRESCGLLSRPTEFDIKGGNYILDTEVYSYFAPQFATPDLADFADWIASDGAEALIAGRNLINNVPSRMALQDMGLNLIHTAAVENDFDGGQFATVVRALRNAERSSAAFRFEPGSSVLDPDSRLAINGLAQQIAGGVFEGFEVVLVGFSDSSGPSDINTSLAAERAAAVQSALLSALPEASQSAVNITTLSAGELMPVSCNTTEAGRERNRRVETWIRLN